MSAKSKTITATVHGEPIQRSYAKLVMGNGRLLDNKNNVNSRLHRWQELINDQLKTVAKAERWTTPIEGPIELEVAFYLPKPKTVKRKYPFVKTKLDMLVRSVLFGVAPQIIGRQEQIVKMSVTKLYTVGDPFTTISVTRLPS